MVSQRCTCTIVKQHHQPNFCRKQCPNTCVPVQCTHTYAQFGSVPIHMHGSMWHLGEEVRQRPLGCNLVRLDPDAAHSAAATRRDLPARTAWPQSDAAWISPPPWHRGRPPSPTASVWGLLVKAHEGCMQQQPEQDDLRAGAEARLGRECVGGRLTRACSAARQRQGCMRGLPVLDGRSRP
jgi:hypothetical protein